MPIPIKLLLGVLAVVSIVLLYVLVDTLCRHYTGAKVAVTRAQLACYPPASSNYFKLFNSWPQSITDFTNNSSNITFIASSTPNQDAWGHPIRYEPYDSARGYGRVLSYGRDGKPGGTGPDADIEFQFGK